MIIAFQTCPFAMNIYKQEEVILTTITPSSHSEKETNEEDFVNLSSCNKLAVERQSYTDKISHQTVAAILAPSSSIVVRQMSCGSIVRPGATQAMQPVSKYNLSAQSSAPSLIPSSIVAWKSKRNVSFRDRLTSVRIVERLNYRNYDPQCCQRDERNKCRPTTNVVILIAILILVTVVIVAVLLIFCYYLL